MKLGFIGLGRMGSRMVIKLLKEGHEVVVWNRTAEKISNLKSQISNFKYRGNLILSTSVNDLTSRLDLPRIVWLMLPAGEATQEVLDQVENYIDANDIVIDGGNAHFTDTQKRYESFSKKGVEFLGIGVSGGLIAAKEGYPLMVGGSEKGYEQIRPILDSLAQPNGAHAYFGKGGAGHFVKMVHNGIEYGIMQSIGEGFGVLEKSPYKLDLVKVARLYQKGTLVSGFMMERTIESLEKDSTLSKLDGVIDATGEGEWTIKQGKREMVPVEIIEQSLNFRNRSKSDKDISASFAARMVAALRNVFGGHEVKKKS